MTDYLAATWAVLSRDLRTALSYRFAFYSQLLGAVFSLTLFYYLSRLVHVRVFDSPDAYYAFAVVGLVILQVLNSTLQTPANSLRGELVAGTFERLALSQMGPVGALAAGLVFPLVNALVIGLVMLGFSALAFDMPVQWSTAALAIPLGILGALAFAPFGLLLMALVMVVKQAASGATWIVALISLISGLYFPVSLLPGWIEWASDVQPFTSAVELLRNVLVGTPLEDPLWLDLARVAASAVVLMPAAIVVLRWATNLSRRRGTFIEY